MMKNKEGPTVAPVHIMA